MEQQHNYSFRIDSFTDSILRQLAEAENRKRGAYLKLLIRREAIAKGIVPATQPGNRVTANEEAQPLPEVKDHERAPA